MKPIERIDRFLAIVTGIAVFGVVFVLVLGPEMIGAEKESGAKTETVGKDELPKPKAAPDGKKIFSSNCAVCHTLAAADANGGVGPNLDELKPDAATVSEIVSNGGGGMPSFGGDLEDAEIAAVAEFVSASAGQ